MSVMEEEEKFEYRTGTAEHCKAVLLLAAVLIMIIVCWILPQPCFPSLKEKAQVAY